jgi:hypothetical protein
MSKFNNIVVKINVKSRKNEFNKELNNFNIESSSGTGFFITKNLILTCYHVIKDAIKINILYKQTNDFTCSVKYILYDDDLAVIEVEPNPIFDDVEILDFYCITGNENSNRNNSSNSVYLNTVFTIGFPLSSTNIKVTKGIISGFQDSKLQTDASLNHGNSGGPLLFYDNKIKKYKILGINVSKVSNAESTGFVVPIYRFLIFWNLVNKGQVFDKYIHKPLLEFDYQELIQEKLRDLLYDNYKIKQGIRISILNSKYYLNNYFKQNEILLRINNFKIDVNGFVKLNITPDKISIDDIGLWFMPGDIIKFHVYSPEKKEIRIENIKLEVIKQNLINDLNITNDINKFSIENNGLIYSVITNKHLNSLKNLNLTYYCYIQIINRFINQKDLFTIYLSDINIEEVSKINKQDNFSKYPIGQIIIELNDKTFSSYDEFINICKEKIIKIKTIDNDIYLI